MNFPHAVKLLTLASVLLMPATFLPAIAQGSLHLVFVLSPSDLTSLGIPKDTVKRISLAATQGAVYAVNFQGSETGAMGGPSVHMRVAQGVDSDSPFAELPYAQEKTLSTWDVPCDPRARYALVPLKFTWAGLFNVYMTTGAHQSFWGKMRVEP